MSINQILQESMKTIAMESEEEVLVDNDDDLDTLNDALDDIDENTEVEMELAACENAIEITESTIMGMESLATVVTEFQKNGGLDATSAALLNASVNSIMAPFGGATTKPMPSLESYEGDGGRAASTAYALEGIRETISNMWKSLTVTIKRAQMTTVKWFTTNNATISRIAKTSAALAAKAKDSEGNPVKDTLTVRRHSDLVTNGNLVGLTVNGISAVSAGEISSTMEPLVSSGLNFAKEIAGLQLDKIGADDFGAKLLASVGAVRKAIVSKSKEMKGSEIMHEYPWAADFVDSWEDARFYVYKNESLPGNYHNIFAIPVDESKMPEKLGTLNEKIHDKKDQKKEYTHKAFTAAEIVKYCNALTTTATKISSEKDSEKKIISAFHAANNVADAINQAMRALDSSESVSKNHSNFVNAIKDIKILESNIRESVIEIRKHAANTLFAGYGFAYDSYANLKAEKVEDKEEDKEEDK